MALIKTLIAIIAILVIILAGAIVADLYLMPTVNNTQTSTTSPTTTHSSTSSRLSSSSSSLAISTITSSSIRTYTQTSASTLTTVITSSTLRSNSSYALELVTAGPGPAVSSPMNTPMATTYIPHDGPCCTQPPVSGGIVNYTDQGNTWAFQGDIEPGTAWASANSSGLTVSYDTSQGGPNHEFWGDHEAFNDASIYGDLAGIPSNAEVFSVQAYIPYHSYYSSCQQDQGGNSSGSGCTYELTPYDSAALAYDVGGNYVVVSIAEICASNPCTSNALQMSAFTSQGGASIVKTLALENNPVYSPLHKLTIATDRKTFIDFYVDNVLLYSNTTMPIDLSGGGLSLQLSQRTSINNETHSVTWSNAAAFTSSSIAVSGLASGMSLVVNGAGGFSQTAASDSNGVATVNVSLQPQNLTLGIESNGNLILSFPQEVSAGAELKFVVNTATTTLISSYTSTSVTTYRTTNETTIVTTYVTTLH